MRALKKDLDQLAALHIHAYGQSLKHAQCGCVCTWIIFGTGYPFGKHFWYLIKLEQKRAIFHLWQAFYQGKRRWSAENPVMIFRTFFSDGDKPWLRKRGVFLYEIIGRTDDSPELYWGKKGRFWTASQQICFFGSLVKKTAIWDHFRKRL